MLGIKQDALAVDLNVSQQTVSNMEGKEQLDDETLGKVAGALGIKSELIKNFVPEDAIYYIQNNFEGSNSGATSVASIQNYQCTFNPLEKLVEAMDEIKNLYAQLLQAEKEKNELLKNMIEEKSI